jgi:transcriptional regulator with XRE-family HTH domain
MPKPISAVKLPRLDSAEFGAYVSRALDGPLQPYLSMRSLGKETGLRSRLSSLIRDLVETEFPASMSLAVYNLREMRGLTQVELGIKAGLTHGFISHLEAGIRGASMESLPRIAEGLGVPVGMLLLSKSAGPTPASQLRLREETIELMLDETVRNWVHPDATPSKTEWSSADLTRMIFSPYLRTKAEPV